METQTFAFCKALTLIKEGKRATRKGWNGQGMFIYLVPAGKNNETIEMASETGTERFSYRDYIAIKTVDNQVVPWVASQTDLLAEDWQEATN